MYYIGIVPGEETGIAVWNNRKRKIESAELVEFWDCISKLQHLKKTDEIKVILKSDAKNNCITTETDSKKIKQKAREKAASRRDLIHFINYCTEMNIDFKSAEITGYTWNAERLRLLTGINKRMRKQVKEAVQLIWGK
jgi:hypothetical protein